MDALTAANALAARKGQALALLLAALAATWAPHAERFPWWFSSLLALGLAARLYWEKSRRELPGRWWLLPPTLALAGWAVWWFRPFFGGPGSLALLSGMLVLKLFEMRQRRDRVVVVLLGYVLLGTRFLYEQTLPSALWMLLLTVVYTVLLAHTADPSGKRPWRGHLAVSLRLLAQAAPLAALLFLLFPRAGGPLWTLPTHAAATTGLSEELTLSGITELAQSDDLVFRAVIDGDFPRERMYWRGLVYDVYDGKSWRSSGAARRGVPLASPVNEREGRTMQRIVLEPQGRPWLFALDVPLSTELGQLQGDLTLRSAVRNVTRVEYLAVSDPGALVLGMPPKDFIQYTALPAGTDDRVKTLAGSFGNRGETPDGEIVRRALAYFQGAGLVYTLKPPPFQGDPVAAFLFETKAGFCAHYASSLATLLRAAGIPARVVAGYLGGEYNPLTGHWMVLQQHAHAWVEAWEEGRGWVRLDPTAAANPQRLSSGIDPDASAAGGGIVFGAFGDGWLSRAVTPLFLLWDGINYEWNLKVLGFNRERQLDLFKGMGLERAASLALAALAAALCWLGGMALWLAWRQRRSLDPAERLWRDWTRRVARAGLGQMPWEGPLDFSRRAARAFPETQSASEAIGALYARWRYGDERTPELLAALRLAVSAWKRNAGSTYDKARNA